MFEILKYAFKISRFRFWLYTAGTFVVGFCLAAQNIETFFMPEYYLFLFYFFFPANIFIYGINDYWDQKTDELNPKKGTKEEKLTKKKKKSLKKIIWASIIFSFALFFVLDFVAILLLVIFLFLSYFYSAPPLRFKSIPFVDFSSNMLYIMPGIFGYYLSAGALPPLILILAGYFHIAAMHLFSAIPDIKYDKKANVKTTATIIGYYSSLILCFIFWNLLSFIVITLSFFNPFSFVILIYPLIVLALLISKKLDINKVYWYFPYINSFLGGMLTILLVWNILFLI
jgi:lycopene elongase/hydratase (dihydrobisanhydrobacterioruberin-forming)